MPLDYAFRCPLPNGLHARPASHFAEAAAQYQAQVTLVNERSGATADATSVLDLVSAGVMHGDPCRLTVTGADERAALAALVAFITDVLPSCDEPLPEVVARAAASIPRVLAGEELTCLSGVPVCPGIGIGRIIVAGATNLPDMLDGEAAGTPEEELLKVTAAVAAVTARLQAQLARTANHTEAEILRANLAIVKDAGFAQQLSTLVSDGGRSAGQATIEATRELAAKLNATGSTYLRERVVDLQDIGVQLLEHISGRAIAPPAVSLAGPSIVMAASLSPSQLLALDRDLLRGLALSEAGTTSHAVILARSFGIPTVTGVDGASALVVGQEVVLDANRGLVIYPVADAVRRFYIREVERDRQRLARLAGDLGAPAATQDGRRIEVSANIATAAEAEAALASGAESVGLFRTEMLFSGRDTPPSEEEQFEIYKAVAEAMGGRAVIIRTIDVGGDKPLPYLNLPREDNPFLGYRGLRIYQEFAEIINSQLRAIVRASAYGKLWVMAPMVSTVKEAAWFRQRVADVQAALESEGVDSDPALPVGIMVEVPSVALVIDRLSEVADFFSIGTNDLCQYFMAVDRGNQQVAGLYDARQPAFLRLLQIIVEEAHRCGRWVGMCGEMAGKADHAPLLVGLGLDELSLSAPNIPAVKAAIAGLDFTRCCELLESATACDSAAAVGELLRSFGEAAAVQPLISEKLIVMRSDCSTKAEAIKELADLLYVEGRTVSSALLEEAVWAREAEYSTGLGFGFAIPHCKTDGVSANVLAILKLAQPIEWDSLDDKPVEFVILLAVRKSDAGNVHLRIFAKLARKLMNESFRAALLAAPSAGALLAHLVKELEIDEEGEKQ